MKKSSIIILFGLACLLLAGYVFMLRSGIADREKAMAGLKRERDLAWKTKATLEDENKGLRQKMRNLQDLLTQAEARLADFKNTVKKIEEDPVNTEHQENELDSWLGRVTQLKNYIKKHPEYAIPEFQYLTDREWLSVSQSDLVSEADYRRSLAILRQSAMTKASQILRQAVSDFTKANNGNLPQNYENIFQYLPDGFPYERYTDIPPEKLPSSNPGGKSQHWIIKDAGPVDTIWDAGISISAQGDAAMSQINLRFEAQVRSAIKSYQDQYGSEPTNSDQIIQYFNKNTQLNKSDIAEIYKSIMTQAQ